MPNRKFTEGADCTMKFQREGSRLLVWASGTSSFASTVACWERIVAEVQAFRPRTLLLVDRLEGRGLTEHEWESLIHATRGQGLEQVRIAHVKPQGRDVMEHCERYASEVGLAARVFEDEAAARQWLEENEAATT